MDSRAAWPKLGCGVGLRPVHYPVILQQWPKIDWFEAISENYMDSGGRPLAVLEQIRERYPVALHGVALSIGSVDPLNDRYLQRLKNLADRIQPAIVSDHLCWSGAGGQQLHDLLPLPFTETSVEHVVSRVEKVQIYLKRRILLENVSTYVTFKESDMKEWEFLAEVSKRSGCGILLDLNNIYVNSKNHGFDPMEYLAGIPAEAVGQFHLAGHVDMGTYLFDTHSRPVIEPVWNLYREAIRRFGHVSTLVEWDDEIPEWSGLMSELEKARQIYKAETPVKTAAVSASKPFSVKKAETHSLSEIQNWMKERIRPSEGSQRAGSFLNPQGDVSGEARLSVYADGYRIRIREGLREVYDAVSRILGEQKFSEIAELYAKKFPSQDYNLGFTGNHFADFLKEINLKAYPFLEDLARFEWLIAVSFHAFDDTPFDRSQLAQIPLEDWENARIYFQASVSLYFSQWPVMDLWKSRETLSPETAVPKERQYVLIGRKGTQIRCEQLDEKQYRLLEGLLCGRTLGEVCEELASFGGTETLPVAEWFTRWVLDGLVRRCEITSKL